MTAVAAVMMTGWPLVLFVVGIAGAFACFIVDALTRGAEVSGKEPRVTAAIPPGDDQAATPTHPERASSFPLTSEWDTFVEEIRNLVEELGWAADGTPEARLRDSLQAALDQYDEGRET